MARDAFTPSRIVLLSWAFAAILMGTVALASYQFGNAASGGALPGLQYANRPLPPAGDVRSTGSTGRAAVQGVEVLRYPDLSEPSQVTTLEQSQIEVLQEQIVRLRRRLSTLSEQNISYSRRISALEQDIAPLAPPEEGRLAVADEQSGQFASDPPPALMDDVVQAIAAARQGSERLGPVRTGSTPLPKPERLATSGNAGQAGLKELAKNEHQREKAPPRRITIHSGQQSPNPRTASEPAEPVRIVQLPSASGEPSVTGSIPPASATPAPENFDSAPTQTLPQPEIISPTRATGRLRGGGTSVLRRSDFGAVVGFYPTRADAANAWARFKDQNAERMEDLRPLIRPRESNGDIALLVGPFGNAADAAAACFRLLEVAEVCQPALFAGAPLAASAGFPERSY